MFPHIAVKGSDQKSPQIPANRYADSNTKESGGNTGLFGTNKGHTYEGSPGVQAGSFHSIAALRPSGSGNSHSELFTN